MHPGRRGHRRRPRPGAGTRAFRGRRRDRSPAGPPLPHDHHTPEPTNRPRRPTESHPAGSASRPDRGDRVHHSAFRRLVSDDEVEDLRRQPPKVRSSRMTGGRARRIDTRRRAGSSLLTKTAPQTTIRVNSAMQRTSTVRYVAPRLMTLLVRPKKAAHATVIAFHQTWTTR
jgi:hypothetical protein